VSRPRYDEFVVELGAMPLPRMRSSVVSIPTRVPKETVSSPVSLSVEMVVPSTRYESSNTTKCCAVALPTRLKKPPTYVLPRWWQIALTYFGTMSSEVKQSWEVVCVCV